MVTLSGLSKSYGDRTLFADVSLQINRGDRIGLVGPNGAGKSTLLALILGELPPDAGEIQTQRNVSFGHLPQETAPVREETVLDLATSISAEFQKLKTTLARWEIDPPTHDVPDLVEAQQRFEDLGGRQMEARAKKILRGLAFRERDFDRPLREMSGGWVMRAYLAQLLVKEPDLLMLDEPTNHLDLEALLWLQDYLKGYPGAILLISHDREFLNQLTGSIVEIRQSKLWRYRGNYEDYLTEREAQEEQLWAAYKNQQREIARLMTFVNRFRAKNTKATQAQSKLKQIERMEKVEAPAGEAPEISFRFPQPLRSGLKVITLTDIHHAYGSQVVYQGMDFQARRGQRIVLVGPNGAGKSTLLKILAGAVEFQSGQRELGHNVRTGYYSQYRTEMLHLDRTVLEEALDTTQRVTEQFVRTLLGCFLFVDDDVFKKVAVLSGGEKSRLALVKALLDPPNLLLMDEPTTHLDMASIEALLTALKQYQGTLIFISHDVYFIRAIADHVVHVDQGRLTHYPGPYQYYLEKKQADSAREPTATGAPENRLQTLKERPSVKIKEQKRREAEQRQQRSRQRKAKQEAVARLESEIAELEQRQTELTAALETPQTYQQTARAVAVNQELADVVERLHQLTADWEIAAAELNALESGQGVG